MSAIALRAAALAAISCAVLTSCGDATQVTYEIVVEPAYREGAVVSVQLGRGDDVEGAAPRVVRRERWGRDGVVGTVVAVPGEGVDTVAARIVVAFGREASSCSASEPAGCIVARRVTRVESGSDVRDRVVLLSECLGVYCDGASTCGPGGVCAPLDGSAPAPAPPGAAPGGALDDYARAVLADRPRAYYRLDEPAGASRAVDLTGRTHGRYVGSVTLGATGGLRVSDNASALFDGGDARLVVDDAPAFGGAFTLEAWVRSDMGDSAAVPAILERVDDLGGGLRLGYRLSTPPVGEQLEIFRGAEIVKVASTPRLGFAGFSHLAAVVRGDKLTLYRDGVVSAELPNPGTDPQALLAPLLVGGSSSGAPSFRGGVDELALYDYPLERAQIVAHIEASGSRVGGDGP